MLFLDDLNRKVEIPHIPKRVISLCPSITETLIEMDVPVVGRTKFCIHPKNKISSITVVGGTKSVHYHKIDTLMPDLIIAEKEENTQEIVENLAKKYPVYVVNVQSWNDGLQMLKNFGEIFRRFEIVNQWFQILSKTPFKIAHGQKIAYLIWFNPIMTVGRNTYINDLLHHLGFLNLFENREGRYPTITMEDLLQSQLDYLFLSSEPFPFQEKHIKIFQKELPDTKIMKVNGEMFSWYGVRMLKALEYFKEFSLV